MRAAGRWLWTRIVRPATLSVGDALWPQTCLVTGEWLSGEAGPLSLAAHAALAALGAVPACPRCGRTARAETLDDEGCGGCRDEAFWNVKELVRVGPYEPPLRDLLLALKFGGDQRAADVLAELLAARLRDRPWLPDVTRLVPVPMPLLRRWQRPCDHAKVLATEVGARLGIRVSPAVRCAQYAPSQEAAHSHAARFRNVRNAFAMRYGVRVIGETVCIIDNVATSGATLCAMSRILRAAGARYVYAAIIGRAALATEPQPEAAAASGSEA